MRSLRNETFWLNVVPLVPLPSLNDAIEALNGFCDDLFNTLQEILDIGAELEHKEHIRTDNLEEVCKYPAFCCNHF